MKMEKEMRGNEKRGEEEWGGMFREVEGSVEIVWGVGVRGKWSEKEYEGVLMGEGEVKGGEGKMGYVRGE